MDKLKSIQSFVYLAELGSFTKVAERRNTVKSVISKEIANLETDLGVRLLHRSTRNISLTEQGQAYLASCLTILQQLDDAKSYIQQKQQSLTGTLKINAPMSLGLTELPNLFSDFSQAHPELELDIHLNDERQDLIKQGFDIGFRVSSKPLDSHYIGKPLTQFYYHIIASPNYLAAHPPIQKAQDLALHNCLVYQLFQDTNHWPLNDKTIHVSGTIKANSTLFLRQLVEANVGIALVPDFICKQQLQQGTLVSLLPEVERPLLTLYAMYPARQFVPPKIKRCIDFFQQWFEENTPQA